MQRESHHSDRSNRRPLRSTALKLLLAQTLILVAPVHASAQSNARCVLNAHVSFSNGITQSQSVGEISSNSASWTCSGTLGDQPVTGTQQLLVKGAYGHNSDGVFGDFGPDTCTAGSDQLTVLGRQQQQGTPMDFPWPLTMHLFLDRTAATYQVDGWGAARGSGLTISGSGTFEPDSGGSCALTPWSSGYLTMALSVVDGPLHSAAPTAHKKQASHSHRSSSKRRSKSRSGSKRRH